MYCFQEKVKKQHQSREGGGILSFFIIISKISVLLQNSYIKFNRNLFFHVWTIWYNLLSNELSAVAFKMSDVENSVFWQFFKKSPKNKHM